MPETRPQISEYSGPEPQKEKENVLVASARSDDQTSASASSFLEKTLEEVL